MARVTESDSSAYLVDDDFVAEYLTAALEDPNPDVFPAAVGNIAVSSNAFTLATLGMVRAELERGQVVPLLHEPWMHSEWAIVRLRRRTMSPDMTAFFDELVRTHHEVFREEERLRERWYRPGNAHHEAAKPGQARVKPTRARREASAGGKRR
jgi:hypothetical protein